MDGRNGSVANIYPGELVWKEQWPARAPSPPSIPPHHSCALLQKPW